MVFELALLHKCAAQPRNLIYQITVFQQIISSRFLYVVIVIAI